MGREGAFPREAARSSPVARLPGSLPAVCSGDAREGFRAGGWPEWSFVARFPTRVNQGGGCVGEAEFGGLATDAPGLNPSSPAA